MSAQTLPAWVYYHEPFLQLERSHFLEQSWTLVCHLSDIPNPGDYQTITLYGEPVVVLRDTQHTVRGFYNVCRHRAARLLDGAGNCGSRIVCPYHAWGYETDGELTWVPYEEQYADLDRSQHGLVSVETDVWMGFVFVRLRPGEHTPQQWLAPLAEDLALYRLDQVQPLDGLSHRLTQCNWKNAADNYVDALHVKLAHPGLNSLLNTTYDLADLGQGYFRLSGEVEHVVGRSQLAKRYHAVLPDVDYLPDSHKRRWLYYLVWPNLAFNLYPDQVEFMQFLPVDAQTTLIRFGNYAVPDQRDDMIEARGINLRLNTQVGDEDNDLIERVQVGMNSRSYHSGPLGANEVCLQGFAQRLCDVLPIARQSEPTDLVTLPSS